MHFLKNFLDSIDELEPELKWIVCLVALALVMIFLMHVFYLFVLLLRAILL